MVSPPLSLQAIAHGTEPRPNPGPVVRHRPHHGVRTVVIPDIRKPDHWKSLFRKPYQRLRCGEMSALHFTGLQGYCYDFMRWRHLYCDVTRIFYNQKTSIVFWVKSLQWCNVFGFSLRFLYFRTERFRL